MAPTDAAASGSDATTENQNASNTVESNSTASTDAIVNKYMDLVSKLEVHTHTHLHSVQIFRSVSRSDTRLQRL